MCGRFDKRSADPWRCRVGNEPTTRLCRRRGVSRLTALDPWKDKRRMDVPRPSLRSPGLARALEPLLRRGRNLPRTAPLRMLPVVPLEPGLRHPLQSVVRPFGHHQVTVRILSPPVDRQRVGQPFPIGEKVRELPRCQRSSRSQASRPLDRPSPHTGPRPRSAE